MTDNKIETEKTGLEHFPEFIGMTYSAEQLDGIMAYAFKQGDLEYFRSLFASKWWDYRFIHPGHCLFLYAHHYGDALDCWRSRFGIALHRDLDRLCHPIYRQHKTERILVPVATRTGWIRGMMFADHYGIPYDRWIEFAFEFAFDAKWEKVPLPGQMYSSKMVSYIVKRWGEEKADLLRLPADPRYLAANFVGHPWQIEFEQWLCKLIDDRPCPEIPLRNFLINEPYLDSYRAARILGNAVVRKATSY